MDELNEIRIAIAELRIANQYAPKSEIVNELKIRLTKAECDLNSAWSIIRSLKEDKENEEEAYKQSNENSDSQNKALLHNIIVAMLTTFVTGSIGAIGWFLTIMKVS